MLLHYTLNQLQEIDAWVGSKFDATMPSILILAESDCGSPERLSTYVPKWIAECVTDKTFTDIYTACSASTSTVFSGLSKQNFWDAIAFYNFIPGKFSPAAPRLSPTSLSLKFGIRPLHLVLDVLRPHGVLIVGLAHSKYSQPVVQAHGIPNVVVRHPASGVTTKSISADFDQLIKISTP